MSANQLMAKALSTTSEDEAISCLKMARKKGLKIAESASFNVLPIEVEKEWAQLVTQARQERDKYKTLWANEGYRNKKLQSALDRAAFLQIMSIIATTFIVSIVWLFIWMYS